MTLTFGQLNSQIQADVPVTQKERVKRAVNRVIGAINSKFPGLLATETGIKNVTGTLTAQTGYTFTTATRILQINEDCKEIIRVFENGIELERRGLEYCQEDANSDEKVYAITARNSIYLPSGLADSEDDEISIQMLKDISQIADSESATVIPVPKQLEQTTISGVGYYILSTVKDRDEILFAEFKEGYNQLLEDASKLEANRLPNEFHTKEYSY